MTVSYLVDILNSGALSTVRKLQIDFTQCQPYTALTSITYPGDGVRTDTEWRRVDEALCEPTIADLTLIFLLALAKERFTERMRSAVNHVLPASAKRSALNFDNAVGQCLSNAVQCNV